MWLALPNGGRDEPEPSQDVGLRRNDRVERRGGERRAVKIAVNTGREPPPANLFGDAWDGGKDGKPFHRDRAARDLRQSATAILHTPRAAR